MVDKPLAVPDAYHSATELAFVSSAARTMFVLRWAECEESHGRTHHGMELMAVAPPMPSQFLREGWRFLGAVEATNAKSIHVLIYAAAKADGCSVDDVNVNWFAHYAVMQAVGHGVSWFDSHAEFDYRLPMWEIIDLDPDQYPVAPDPT